MEDAGGEDRISTAHGRAFDEVVQRTHAAAGDHRDGHGVDHSTSERELEAVARPVAVHGREEDLTRTPVGRFLRPFDGIDPRRGAPAAGEQLITVTTVGPSAGIDRDHDRLRAELDRQLVHQFRPVDRSRHDAHLVRPGAEEGSGILHRADAPANGEGDEDRLRRPAHDIEHRRTLLHRGRDIEEHDLVGTLLVVARGQLDRVAGVTKTDEIDALHDPAVVDVEAGDHPHGAH